MKKEILQLQCDSTLMKEFLSKNDLAVLPKVNEITHSLFHVKEFNLKFVEINFDAI